MGCCPAWCRTRAASAVLMLGYLNRESLRETLLRGRVVFFSRTRQRLWEKGETSGHYLEAGLHRRRLRLRQPAAARAAVGSGLPSQYADLLRRRRPARRRRGCVPVRGWTRSSRRASPSGRKAAIPRGCSPQGIRRMAQKVGEEGVEVALAGSCGNEQELVSEAADLLFHLALLLRARGLSLAQVAARAGRAPQRRARRWQSSGMISLRRRAQVVAGRHRAPVGTGIRDQQHVALVRVGQQAVVAEHVAALADRSHHVVAARRRRPPGG